jgi:hypothetical protein
MNRRLALPAIVLVCAFVLGSRPAAADPIQVTGGQIQMAGFSGTMLLLGERDFSLSARVGVLDAFFGPFSSCDIACFPGSTIDLGAQWAGLSFSGGTLMIDGQRHTQFGGLTSPTGGVVQLFGSVMAPPLDGETLTLVAPFLLEGRFFYPGATGIQMNEVLMGQGTVFLSLRRVLGGDTGLRPGWAYTSATYEFEPIPEPTTMVLAGSGLLGLAGGRIRRRWRTPRATSAREPQHSA